MDTGTLVAILMFGTLLAVAVFALFNIAAVEKRRKDPNAPKSTLAADKASDGKPVDV